MAMKADEAALELMKQLIALSSGVLALSATFIEKFRTESFLLLLLLILSWLALLVSVIWGLETISAIVKSRLNSDDDWSKGYGRTSARVSKYSFVIGITLFAAFAFLTLVLSKPDKRNMDNGIAKEQQFIAVSGSRLKT